MTVIRLLILGVFHAHGRTHGYAVHRELSSWKVEMWTSVKVGSIYHALKQLTKEGKLQEAGTEASSKGPGRTTFELTDSGREEFISLLEEALHSFDLERFSGGVALMSALPRARVLALLRGNVDRATQNRDFLNTLSRDAPRGATPHTKDLLELWSATLTAWTAWAHELTARLEGGEYRFAGE